jgi:hypothetical protein
MAINIKLFKETIIRTLALLIFDRNLIPMLFPSLNIHQKTQTGSIPEEDDDDDDECLAAVFLREFMFLPSRLHIFAPFNPELLGAL